MLRITHDYNKIHMIKQRAVFMEGYRVQRAFHFERLERLRPIYAQHYTHPIYYIRDEEYWISLMNKYINPIVSKYIWLENIYYGLLNLLTFSGGFIKL